MQNAHKAAFVVFRRLKRQGYDKVSLIFQSSRFPRLYLISKFFFEIFNKHDKVKEVVRVGGNVSV